MKLIHNQIEYLIFFQVETEIWIWTWIKVLLVSNLYQNWSKCCTWSRWRWRLPRGDWGERPCSQPEVVMMETMMTMMTMEIIMTMEIMTMMEMMMTMETMVTMKTMMTMETMMAMEMIMVVMSIIIISEDREEKAVCSQAAGWLDEAGADLIISLCAPFFLITLISDQEKRVKLCGQIGHFDHWTVGHLDDRKWSVWLDLNDDQWLDWVKWLGKICHFDRFD